MSPKDPSLDPDEIARMVMLVYGQMEGGNPFWCYVSVKPSRYDEVCALGKSKKLELRTFESDGFGEVIVSGEGVMPPPDVTQKVAAMFNVPIRELFADIDPKAAVAKEIDRLKNENS